MWGFWFCARNDYLTHLYRMCCRTSLSANMEVSYWEMHLQNGERACLNLKWRQITRRITRKQELRVELVRSIALVKTTCVFGRLSWLHLLKETVMPYSSVLEICTQFMRGVLLAKVQSVQAAYRTYKYFASFVLLVSFFFTLIISSELNVQTYLLNKFWGNSEGEINSEGTS